jgi:predicted nucleic acid-binding protein
MHKIKHTASPYIYQMVLDSDYKLSEADIKKFEREVSHGVSVYGFTPNIIIVSNSHYRHWDSISLLAAAMDTGKLAICSNDNLNDVIDNISNEFQSIDVKLFGTNDINNGIDWITSTSS